MNTILSLDNAHSRLRSKMSESMQMWCLIIEMV